ncbi:MAG: sulfatase-like hydrolase/transferase [Verrucomicrobia bacterium]|nr:sulfatase-like hydrolase/transferase [Verrucomicrobiota bacterium]
MDAAGTRPNIVLILADDLGYGDLGGPWGGKANTPHLDQLAREGLRFTDFHSNGAMCTPTRASLLTGRYPQRMGFERAYATKGREERGIASPGIHEITIASYLRQAGYATGIFGKWHLGKHASANPVRFGFDEFRGLTDGDGDYFSKLDRFGGDDWLYNEDLVHQGGYATTVTTDNAIRFIERHRDRPFFLYVPYQAVHFPWQEVEDDRFEIRRLGEDFTSGKPGPRSKLGPHRPGEIPDVMQRMIQELDRGVGRLMATLRQHGLDRTTLVFFTSDNGAYVHYLDPDFVDPAAAKLPAPDWPRVGSNGPLRGQKTQLYEGGHRVPAIAWWPGKIAPGATTSQTTMTMDILPTVMELLAIKPPAETGPNALDGISLLPLLLRGETLASRTLFWRAPTQTAVREGSWKLVNQALYNLAEDIGESRDLAAQRPEVVRRLKSALTDWETKFTKR